MNNEEIKFVENIVSAYVKRRKLLTKYYYDFLSEGTLKYLEIEKLTTNLSKDRRYIAKSIINHLNSKGIEYTNKSIISASLLKKYYLVKKLQKKGLSNEDIIANKKMSITPSHLEKLSKLNIPQISSSNDQDVRKSYHDQMIDILDSLPEKNKELIKDYFIGNYTLSDLSYKYGEKKSVIRQSIQDSVLLIKKDYA